MLGTLPATRLAIPAERDRIASTLVRAFDDDPLVRWVFDRPSVRRRSTGRFFRWWVGELIEQDVTWTTPDLTGAAVWALPRQWRSSALSEARLGLSIGLGVRAPLTKALSMARVEAKHPAEPHLYLAMLGVDPRYQGRGLGSALITSGLDIADEERWPAYLETANDQNLAFYGRHGFEVIERFDLPRGGPSIWRMWRAPR